MMSSPSPVYLLPGLLCDATVWTHQIETLSKRGPVVVPDFRGFSSLTDMARSVLKTAPEAFCLAGHSMGARVALEIMRLAPERVERLALLDTGTHPPKAGEPAQRQRLVDLAYAEGMEALASEWLSPMVHEDRTQDEALMAPLRAMVLGMTPDIYRGQITALLNRPDAAKGLSAIRCPTLVGVGRQDRWSPPAQHEPIAAAISGSTYVVFEDSGHMTPFEVPEQVTSALMDWLSL